MKRLRFLALGLFALASTSQAAPEPPKRPRIEVAFAMDATGSMSRYIAEARQRIKEIAENLAEGDPKPDVRFALVAFRDKGDEYVTRVHPFTPELEAMRSYLDATEADGGGDTPEAVLEALQAGVTELSWSPLDGDAAEDVIRLLFLVGDAPAQHYPDSPDEAKLAEEARRRGIVIHSIACRNEPSLETTFERLARHTEGQFFRLGDAATRVAEEGTRGFDASLTGTLTATTKAYSSSVGVDYEESKATHVTTKSFAEGAAPPLAARSGLAGAHVRWARDPKSWHSLWAAHVSRMPNAGRPPLPEVDFSEHAVLVLGGADVGLELEALEQSGERRFARVRPTEAPGVRFVLVPNEEGEDR